MFSGLSDLLQYVWLEHTTCTLGRHVPAQSINQDRELFYCTLLQAGDPLCDGRRLIIFLNRCHIGKKGDLGFPLAVIEFLACEHITVHLISLCMPAHITHRFITQLTTGPFPLPTSSLPPYVWRAPAPSPATQTVAV